MGVIYFCFMIIGAFRYRLPPTGWRPDGWTPPSENKTMITQHQVSLDNAHKTPQFWLIWWVLTLNVSAGIGVIGMASPMLQEIFAGSLIGLPGVKFNALSADQKSPSPRSRRDLPACSRCLTSAAGSSGRRCPTTSGARTPTTRSSSSASPDSAAFKTERPYLELFARKTKRGWHCWGDQVALFDQGSVDTRRQPSCLTESVTVLL
jgi:hypothetical protein